MALAGWWPSVCPKDPVVSSTPVQLERGGGHLEPPPWCPRVASQGRKPRESRQPRTLDTPDSGLLRVPADPHHPWPWGTSSTRAGHQHRRQGQRVHHMHGSVHTCLHRPHSPTSTPGHRLAGCLHQPLASRHTDAPTQMWAHVHPQLRKCNRHTHTHIHTRARAQSIPHPTPLLPALPIPFPACFDQGYSSCEHHTVREGIDLRVIEPWEGCSGQAWLGWGLPEAQSHYPRGTGYSGLPAQPPPLRGVSKPHNRCLINAPEVSQALQSRSPQPRSPD